MVSRKSLLLCAAIVLGSAGATAGVANAAPKAPPPFTLHVFAGAPGPGVFGPDDIAELNGRVFVGWQNAVGTEGQPGPGHQTRSLLVQYASSGRPIARWRLTGRIDGLAGDPGVRGVIATVNRDGDSSLYVVKPGAARSGQVTHFRYSPAPGSRGSAAVHTGGGTDSVVVDGGKILITASNPSHLSATATFRVRLASGGVARLLTTFSDDARAVDAVTGQPTHLVVTDPTANAVVPAGVGDPFGGQYALDAQANQELIFAQGIGAGHTALRRLKLTYGRRGQAAGITDLGWAATANATLYVVDNGANRIYRVRGPFTPDDGVASMDSVGTRSFDTQVAALDDADGNLTPFITGLRAAAGLLFTP